MKALQLAPVRLVIARCSVDYAGRLTAHLPSAPRLLIVKADGSVLVHADGGSYKPLNWMSPPCRLEETPGAWRVVNKAGEELRITIEEILHDTSPEVGADPGWRQDGAAAHLQARDNRSRAAAGRDRAESRIPSTAPSTARHPPAP